jgi:hypothetical protein
MGTPCLLRGVAVVAAFLVTFLAAEKSDSPAGRDPQCQGKQKVVNALNTRKQQVARC